ncbi:MAG: hypothetical protein EPN20_05510 [Magnetospirillum sp.]|nr:MAG: hypothetical protein EPN20_05510 [Magnetospirillum sp.]
MKDTEEAARALMEWAQANPAEAARLWRTLLRHPGGMCNAYIPPLPSMARPPQCSVVSPMVE